jgi:hypothetical protein
MIDSDGQGLCRRCRDSYDTSIKRKDLQKMAPEANVTNETLI